MPVEPSPQFQAADYAPINTPAFSEPDIAAFEPVRPQDFIPLENPVSHTRHYSEQELREIGSKPQEEIVAFFNDIGGNSRLHTETDEETGITVTSTVYSSPLLDNKEFHVTDRDRSYWQTGNDGLIADGEVIVHPTSSAPQSLPLTDTEIQRILASQQGIPPEEPQYEPVGDTAIGQDNDFSGGLATDAADNLSADLIHSQIQASAVGDAIADMRPPIGAVPDTPVQVPAPLPEQTQPPAEQPQTQTAQPENPIPSVDTVQATPAAEAEKHPEETAKTLAGDIASQINTTADLLAKPLEERA